MGRRSTVTSELQGASRACGSGSELDRIRKDFLAAIERIVANSPRDERLIKQMKKGRLKITFSSVALEAGHSRTHIALVRCRLPDVRKRVLDLRVGRESATSAVDVIVKLRAELRALKIETDLLRAGHVELLFQRDEALKEAKRWRDAYQRCRSDSEDARKVVRIVPG